MTIMDNSPPHYEALVHTLKYFNTRSVAALETLKRYIDFLIEKEKAQRVVDKCKHKTDIKSCIESWTNHQYIDTELTKEQNHE